MPHVCQSFGKRETELTLLKTQLHKSDRPESGCKEALAVKWSSCICRCCKCVIRPSACIAPIDSVTLLPLHCLTGGREKVCVCVWGGGDRQ